jgi:uncharacterized protein (DUF1330 family)
MAAYMIVQAEITNPEKFPEYQKLAGPAVQKYNGKILGRGTPPETVEGQWGAPVVLIIEFESVETAKAFFNSPEYTAAREARANTAKFTMSIVPGM